MSTKQVQKPISDIYSYDKQIQAIFKRMERDLPANTVELIQKYDREMVNTSKAKGTRRKHLQTLCSFKITKQRMESGNKRRY